MPAPDTRIRRTGRHPEIVMTRAKRVARDRTREMKDLADMMDAGPPENGVARHNFATIDDAANTLGLTAEKGRVAGRLIREVAEDARDLLSITKAAREAGIPQPAIVEMIRRGMDLRHRLAKGGEGSRGGNVIGHTSSGKPVYASRSAHHSAHQNWSAKDHEEAADLHYAAGEKHGMSDRGRAHRQHSDSHHEAWSHAVAAERRGQAPTFHHRFDSEGVRKGGDSAPVGTVRQRADGRKYRKQSAGKWVPVGQRGGARGADGAGGGSPPKKEAKAPTKGKGKPKAPPPKPAHDPAELRDGKTAQDRFGHLQRMAGAAGKRIHGDFDAGQHSHDHMDVLERQLKQHISNELRGPEPSADETGVGDNPSSGGQAPATPEPDPDAQAAQEQHSAKLSAMHKLGTGLKGKAVFDRAWHALKTATGAKVASAALKKLSDGKAPSPAEVQALVAVGTAAGMAAMVASGYGEHAGGSVLSQQFLSHVAQSALHAHLNRGYAAYAAHSFVKPLHTPQAEPAPGEDPEQQAMAKAEDPKADPKAEAGDDKALQDLVKGIIAQMQDILAHDWTPEEIASAEADGGGLDGDDADEEGEGEGEGAEGEEPQEEGEGSPAAESSGGEDDDQAADAEPSAPGERPEGHDAPEQPHEQHRQSQEAQDAIDKLKSVQDRLDSAHQRGMFQELAEQATEVAKDPSPQALEWLNKRIDSFVTLVSGVNPGEKPTGDDKAEPPVKKALLFDPRTGRLVMKAGGEGSRGGHVMGHTASGKPIYGKPHATGKEWEEAHKHYEPHDHLDASGHHSREARKAKLMGLHDRAAGHEKLAEAHAIAGMGKQKGHLSHIDQSLIDRRINHANRGWGKSLPVAGLPVTGTRAAKAGDAIDARGTKTETPADDEEEDLEVRPVGFRPALPSPAPAPVAKARKVPPPPPPPRTKPALVKGARAPHPRNSYGHRDDLVPGMLLHPRQRHENRGVVEVLSDGRFKLGETIHKGGHSLLTDLYGSADHRTTIRRYFKLGGERRVIPRADILLNLRGLLKSADVVVQRNGSGYALTGDLRKAGVPDYMLTTGDRSAVLDPEAGYDLWRHLTSGESHESA